MRTVPPLTECVKFLDCITVYKFSIWTSIFHNLNGLKVGYGPTSCFLMKTESKEMIIFLWFCSWFFSFLFLFCHHPNQIKMMNDERVLLATTAILFVHPIIKCNSKNVLIVFFFLLSYFFFIVTHSFLRFLGFFWFFIVVRGALCRFGRGESITEVHQWWLLRWLVWLLMEIRLGTSALFFFCITYRLKNL